MKIDKVLFNGKIYTSDQETPWAEALAISGRKIAFAGSNEEARAVADADTEMIDLEGKTILPGFLDGHTHPTTVAKTFYRVRMPLTHDKDELLANIQKYAKQYPKEERPFLFRILFRGNLRAERAEKRGAGPNRFRPAGKNTGFYRPCMLVQLHGPGNAERRKRHPPQQITCRRGAVRER